MGLRTGCVRRLETQALKAAGKTLLEFSLYVLGSQFGVFQHSLTLTGI